MMAVRERVVGTAPARNDPTPIRPTPDPASESGADFSAAHSGRSGDPSSSSDPFRAEAGPVNRKRPSASIDTVDDDARTKEARRGAKNKGKSTQRAAHACLRCRRQKLRCLGGNPCERCIRTSNKCDFGLAEDPAVQSTGDENSTTVKISIGRAESAVPRQGGRDERLHQLENSVATLLGGLAEETDLTGQGYPNLEIFHEVVRHRKEPSKSTPIVPKSSAQRFPPPTHVRPLDPIRFGTDPINPAIPMNRGQHSISPATLFDHSPNDTSSTAPRASEATMNRSAASKVGVERGASVSATESLYEAPFRSLVPQSGRNSPDRVLHSRDEANRFDYRTQIHREDNDPINTGIVTQEMAEALFTFFINHCHPFLPVVDIAPEAAFTTIRRSPPLFSATIAIAARFYTKYNARCSPVGARVPQSLDPLAPARLANLAETHLSHTLLRRRYALTDVQAILLLAAWNLQPGSRSGPDAWVVTGHAARISRRLGVHKVLAQAAETARNHEQGSDEWAKLEGFIPQWRTWLCWFTFDGFLSLGFGRPQSTQFETVDEYGFLQMRLQGSLPRPGSTSSQAFFGDVYIAGQVQLTQIGRDLINWGEMLADPEKAIYADPRRADIFKDIDLSVKTMFSDLNTRLDEWCRLWVWTGSPYALYLGPSARVARLQAEHLRLCLNSYVLKVGQENDGAVGQCLRNAFNAAVNTIQTHQDSSQTDFGLSFATDYLTITLAQAAVFLFRIIKAPQTVHGALKIENAVISHYLQMSIDLLESSDMSETRLGTDLARTLKELGCAAAVPGFAKNDVQEELLPESTRDEDAVPNMGPTPAPFLDFIGPNLRTGNTPGLEDFFQAQNDFDLSFLLGLSSNAEGAFLQDSGSWFTDNTSNAVPFGEFGGLAGGRGPGIQQPTWDGTFDNIENVFGFLENQQG